MKISPVSTFGTFTAKPKSTDSVNRNSTKDTAQNPITKGGEKAKLALATFITGLGVGMRLLAELVDGDFVVEDIGKAAGNIVEKQHKNAKGGKKFLLQLGAFGGLLTIFVAGFAALYTLFKAPNINYAGNVNAFKKQKDMDVYIKGNDTEKEIYTQMNEKAKVATPEEKAKLQEQYMQMQLAKNRVPEFVKNL